MYEFCVFAGTTEGRELTEALLDAGASVTACVATEYGQTLLGSHPKLTISARRLTEEEMEALLASRDFACVIDATHPYASAVTENIAAACEGARAAVPAPAPREPGGRRRRGLCAGCRRRRGVPQRAGGQRPADYRQ